MTTENQELIQKTINTGDQLYGGRLNTAQQDAFVRLVRDTSVLLSKVRFIQMPQSVKQIDKIYVGAPVTRGASETTTTGTATAQGAGAYSAKPTFDSLTLTARKLKSDWAISTETLQENIEGANVEDTIMTLMGKRISTDIELLGIQGIQGGSFSGPLTNLLNVANGYDYLTDGSNVVDAGGQTLAALGPDIFERAVNLMPEHFLQDPDLIWVMSRPIATNWQTHIAKRETAAGDDALRGNTLRPYGFPVLTVPNIPSRKALTVTASTPARQTGTEFGPFEITTGSNDISLNVNGGGAVTIALTPGVYTGVELGYEIKNKLIAAGGAGIAAAAALKFYDDGQGRLVIETVATGTGATIALAGADDANFRAEVGWATASFAGANTGSNVVNEGSFILLCNPKNLIFGMVDETRVYSEFNKDTDRIETVVYNQVAFDIENLEAVVKIANLRRTG